jgi:hypothetical protein
MQVCTTPGSTGTRLQEKNTKKKKKIISKEKKVTKSLYFTYAWMHSFPTDCEWKFADLFRVTDT